MDERISILQDANVISKEVADFVRKVVHEDLNEFKNKTSALEMLTTHLAMATQRVSAQEEVEWLDDMIWKDVVQNEYFDQAQELFVGIESKAPCVYPEGEKRFLIMHLCNLYQ